MFFSVVRYKRVGKDDEPRLAFLQQKLGLKYLLWNGEYQVLVAEDEMRETTKEEANAFIEKIGKEYHEKIQKGLSKANAQVTSLEAKSVRKSDVSYEKPHEEEDNMEVVAATPKKPLTDFDILLAGENDVL